MQYFKSRGKIFGYEPSPNRFQKWWRAIEKVEKKSDAERTDTDWEMLSDEHYAAMRQDASDRATAEYSQFSKAEVTLGLALHLYDLKTAPMSFFVFGEVAEGTPLHDHLKATLPPEPEPVRPQLFGYAPNEWETILASFSTEHTKWQAEWRHF